MRRFTFKVDLRKVQDLGAPPTPALASPPKVRDGFQLSNDLAPQRQSMRDWPRFQQHLASLPEVVRPAEHLEDPELAQEYVRIHGVTRRKILDAAPGFDVEGKTETHCFFAQDGSKHLVSRLIALPNTRLTELSMYTTGEVTRVYYEKVGGGEQDLEDLYQHGVAGLEEDVGRFARFPNYQLKFVLLPCDGPVLVEIYRGVCFYDTDTGTVTTVEE